MKCTHLGFNFILITIFLDISNGAKNSRREDKVFSLFNIVKFPNDACSGSSYTGICLSSAECSNKVIYPNQAIFLSEMNFLLTI